jgi:hypothetical protein
MWYDVTVAWVIIIINKRRRWRQGQGHWLTKYLLPPQISFVLLLLVPDPKSFLSTQATFSPREAASSAAPAEWVRVGRTVMKRYGERMDWRNWYIKFIEIQYVVLGLSRNTAVMYLCQHCHLQLSTDQTHHPTLHFVSLLTQKLLL